MNLRQKIFLFNFLSKLSFLGVLYFGFWAFIYDFAWWNKDIILALMTNAVNMVLCFVCFMTWLLFDVWQSHPDRLMPNFKLERGKKETTPKQPKKTTKDEDAKTVTVEEESLDL